MRVFLSYRRDDTAGRAGRLHDALVSRLGPRNVFMDVATIAVGTDFVEQVDRAIAGSDVSLVVIGPNWLGIEDADGRRRLDDPDDHVRSEVRSALGSSNPVVPVLVGDATLPTEDELPSDLVTLVRRQAFELHDETWAHDVEMLIRRLEGKDLAPSPRRLVPWSVGLVVLVIAGVLVWRGLADTDSGGTPTCEWDPDVPLTSVEVGPEATGVDTSDQRSIRYTVTGADFAALGSRWLVILEVEARNETPASGNQQGLYFSHADFEALLIDGHAADATCFTPISGNRDDVVPGQAASGLVGFETSRDPTDSNLTLGTEGGQIIEVSGGS
ncbi:MAG TPA: toll/interleukin-1 receptor domain-containing protein [Acidimicrobiia bacterium]